MKQTLFYLFLNMIMLLLTIILVMVSVAFFTLFERKILSYSHYRKGPNKVSFYGLLQPFSDAMKLLTKEFFFPMKSAMVLYFFSPMLLLTLILSMWLIYPFMTNLMNWNFNSLFFLSAMSMGVYGLMLSGWTSNSSFSMLGSIRSISQSISYEVAFAISLLLFLLYINSLNIQHFLIFQKYTWLSLMMWPCSLILMISMLAEINRTPFDLSEGESELVSGFNIEYSSHGFILIFLSEYASILFMMFMFNLINFFMNFFTLKFYLILILLMYFVIWIRVTLPRIRYDYLMFFCWFYLLPYLLLLFMIYLTFSKLLMKMMIF